MHLGFGIGLSRLRTYQLLDGEAEVLQEIETAVQTTAAGLAYPVQPGQGNFSLCHGHDGNAELLLLAADVLERPALRQTAEAVAQQRLAQFSQPDMPWPWGLMQAGETPSLRLALAGIGYFFLRLHDPATVPSILLITPQQPD